MRSFDDKIKEILNEQPDIPDVVLNKANHTLTEIRQGHLKRNKNRRWQKHSFQVAAASIAALFVVGTTTFAATQRFSLLSKFKDESLPVQKQAATLLDTDVKQQPAKEQSQAKWASFRVKEAICDKTKVFVALEVTAATPDKYLLVPSEYRGELDRTDVTDLNIQGETETGISIAEYAKQHGKECLVFSVGIPTDAGVQTHEYCTQQDGTFVYTISFENVERTQKLDFVCNTGVYPPNSSSDADMIKDSFTFTLDDQTNSELIQYAPETEEKVDGTELIVDDITFEKSALGMIGNVKYHYAGTDKNWMTTKDGDICFFLYDTNGNELLEGFEGGTDIGDDGITMTQRWHYSSDNLPDTIIIKAKDVFEKIEYGAIKAHLVK